MLLIGEYAVLEGGPAVLMTLRCRLSVTVAPSEKLHISSDRFGTYEEGAGDKPAHARLVENVISRFYATYGFPARAWRITITSDIPPTYGFGSSAALVAALVRALCRASGKAEDFTPMFATAHAALLDTFGRGSGADLAAALADHPFVLFNPAEKTAEPFTLPFAVQAIYTGYKTPTPVLLKQVRAELPEEKWAATTASMRRCAEAFIAAPTLEKIEEYQSYMTALGVTCDACARAIGAFTAQGITAKISGSGRGDCVVGFSVAPTAVKVEPPLEFIPHEDLRAS